MRTFGAAAGFVSGAALATGLPASRAFAALAAVAAFAFATACLLARFSCVRVRRPQCSPVCRGRRLQPSCPNGLPVAARAIAGHGAGAGGCGLRAIARAPSLEAARRPLVRRRYPDLPATSGRSPGCGAQVVAHGNHAGNLRDVPADTGSVLALASAVPSVHPRTKRAPPVGHRLPPRSSIPRAGNPGYP